MNKTYKSIGFYGENQTALTLVNKINKVIKKIKNKKFVFVPSEDNPYDFNKYTRLREFGGEIYSSETSLDEARNNRYEILDMINESKDYNTGKKKKM